MGKSMPGIILKIGANTKDAIDGLNKVNRALGSSATASQKFGASMRKAGPAMGLAAAAAGVLAIKLGTDAVQAAIAEEASVSKLNKALGNLGMSKASEQTSKFVDDLQFATGVADTELRPALSSLAVATGDMAEAQKALSIALDISAQTAKPLSAVVAAMSKGYLGNTQGLLRLNAGVAKNILATGDMTKINAEFARITGGAAATAADTLEGRINILRIGVDELQESFGKGLIQGFMDGLSDGSGSLDDATARLRENQATLETWGSAIGGIVADAVGWLDSFGLGAMKIADSWDDASAAFTRFVINTRDWAGEITDEQADVERAALDAADAAREQAMRNYALKGSLDATESAANGAADATARLTTAAESNVNSMNRQKSAADSLKASMDKLNNNRSIMQQKFDIAGTLQDGPNKSGKRKGADGKMTQFTTMRDRKEFAFTVADQYAGLADSYKKGSKKREALADAREAIRGMSLPGEFKSDLLQTLRPAARNRGIPGTPQTGAQVAAVNYNFYGDIRVPDNNAAVEAAKQAKRLAALAGRQSASSGAAYGGYSG